MRPRTLSSRLPLYPEESTRYPRGVERPVTRGDCVDGPRPCVWASCKFHLFLDVTKAGSLKLNFPADSLDGLVDNLLSMEHSCALDIAGGKDGEGDGVTLEDVGALMNVTRERIRQMEEKFKARLIGDTTVHAALGEEDEYWSSGQVPPMLPGEAGRKLRRSAGHASAALLEVPEDLFELDDEDAGGEGDDAPDRSSGVRATDGAPVQAKRQQEARRAAG